MPWIFNITERERMAICSSCGDGHIIVDPSTGAEVCESCGLEYAFNNFQNQTFTTDGRPEGHILQSVGDFGYRERKIYHAKALMHDLASRLGLSATLAAESAVMASSVTDGTLGGGDWFPVLAAATSYLVARRHRVPIPLSEAAAAVGSDALEVGRMTTRIVSYLDLDPLPEFDGFSSLGRMIRTSSLFTGLERGKVEEIVAQGSFLLQCATKWFITTGRHPLPVIAAIVAFSGEVNGVAVGVEAIASEIYCNATTCKRRLKELKDTLVKAARVLLPWGADVTAKNLVMNAPLLIKLMRMKSKVKPTSEVSVDDLDSLIGMYCNTEADDFKYFKLGNREEVLDTSSDKLTDFKLSKESLSTAYKNMLGRLTLVKERGEHRKKRRKWGFDFDALRDTLQGNWDSDKGLTVEQVVEKDVGYDALPPSFVAGVEARKSRRIKTEAAKVRISEIMKPTADANSGAKEKGNDSNLIQRNGKKRKGGVGRCIDWEDCIIELLLLHRVNEDEIEEGHYKRMLDLYIFSALPLKKNEQ